MILEVSQDAHQAAKSILSTNVLSLGMGNLQSVSYFAGMENWSLIKNVIMVIKLGAKIVKLALGTNAIENLLLIVVFAEMESDKSMSSAIMVTDLAVGTAYSKLATHVLDLKTVRQFVVSCLLAGTQLSRWESNAIMGTEWAAPRTARSIQATAARQS